MEQIERLNLDIYIKSGYGSLTITELKAIKDYIREFSDDIDVIWLMGFDSFEWSDKPQNDEVRLDALLLGKNLQL